MASPSLVRFGLQIPSFVSSGLQSDDLVGELIRVVSEAEAVGFDSIWLMDHLQQIPAVGSAEEPLLEPYTALAVLARTTMSVRLGVLVSAVTHRNPALLAKMTTALDVLSNGRAVLGIGAAWFEEEHWSYGFNFPSVGERMDRLEEAVQICRLMFDYPDGADYGGRYYQLDRAINHPAPVQGRLPILVGGGGEHRTLPIAARLADASNFFVDDRLIGDKVGVLRRHLADAGRDPKDLSITRIATMIVGEDEKHAKRLLEPILEEFPLSDDERRVFLVCGGVESVRDQLAEGLEAGLDGYIVNLRHLHDPSLLALAGEALPRLAS